MSPFHAIWRLLPPLDAGHAAAAADEVADVTQGYTERWTHLDVALVAVSNGCEQKWLRTPKICGDKDEPNPDRCHHSENMDSYELLPLLLLPKNKLSWTLDAMSGAAGLAQVSPPTRSYTEDTKKQNGSACNMECNSRHMLA